MKPSTNALEAVRREVVRAVIRTPQKVLAKAMGQPWPPELEKTHWNSNQLDAYNVPQYHRPLRPSEIRSLVGTDEPVMLEIGANNGEDSQTFLDQFSRMKLFCFEPDVRAIAKFKQRINDHRCTLITKAVSASSGTTSFWHSGGGNVKRFADWDKSGSIHAPTGHLQVAPEIAFDRVTEVATVTLDDWAAEHPELQTIDLIWMDVQGAEHDVFAGGTKTLPKVRYVYSEFYQTPMFEGQKNLDALLGMLPGFSLVSIYEGSNFLARNEAIRYF